MPGRSRNQVRTVDVDNQSRLLLAANIIVIYFLMLIAVVLAIEHFQPSLFRGDYDTFPTEVMFLVWFLYYAVPVGLSIVFGLFFPPFWRSFRNLLIAILAIQFIYSFVVGMLRWDYLQYFQNEKRWRKSDRMKLVELHFQYHDHNEDGFVEEIAVKTRFDFTKLRPGEYMLHAAIIPGGELSPFMIDGGGVFKITKRGSMNMIVKEFMIKPRFEIGPAVDLLEDQNFQVKLMLRRVVQVDEKGKKIIRMNRWAPFLRTSFWQGGDPQIYDDMVPLDAMTANEVFTLRGPSANYGEP